MSTRTLVEVLVGGGALSMAYAMGAFDGELRLLLVGVGAAAILLAAYLSKRRT